MYNIELKATNEQTRKANKSNRIATDNRMVVITEKEGGIVEMG